MCIRDRSGSDPLLHCPYALSPRRTHTGSADKEINRIPRRKRKEKPDCLFLDAHFLLLLVQGPRMFAVALGDGLLQAPVEADHVAGDVAQLVVGDNERLVLK